jgi:hypothetical protein
MQKRANASIVTRLDSFLISKRDHARFVIMSQCCSIFDRLLHFMNITRVFQRDLLSFVFYD